MTRRSPKPRNQLGIDQTEALRTSSRTPRREVGASVFAGLVQGINQLNSENVKSVDAVTAVIWMDRTAIDGHVALMKA